ncbi:MAG: hypothetical protein O2966_07660, partial [Proteobacteria bacterium]|nr:hypothetical protein [Pseudomonadota bacterium]
LPQNRINRLLPLVYCYRLTPVVGSFQGRLVSIVLRHLEFILKTTGQKNTPQAGYFYQLYANSRTLS